MLNVVKKNYKAVLVLLALLTMVFSSFKFPKNINAGTMRHLVNVDFIDPCDTPAREPLCDWPAGEAE